MANTYQDVDHFIRAKRSQFSSAIYSFHNKIPHHTMEALYHEARNLHQFDIPFDKLKKELGKGHYDRHGRGWSRYIYNEEDRHEPPIIYHYEKKVLSEDEKRSREWRAKVKDHRDQAKNRWGRKQRKYWCNQGRRSERRYVKHKLEVTDWEPTPSKIVKWWRPKNEEETMWELHYPDNAWESYYDKHRRCFIDRWAWDW